MPRGKPPFEQPSNHELRKRKPGLERTGERRPPRKGERFLGHQGEIHKAEEDTKRSTSLDDYEILAPTAGPTVKLFALRCPACEEPIEVALETTPGAVTKVTCDDEKCGGSWEEVAREGGNFEVRNVQKRRTE